MNIFMVDEDPEIAARSLVDRHCVKMILESAQLLSTAHRILDGIRYEGKSKSGRKQTTWHFNDARELVLYKATHINHPSAVWARQSVENYNWLVEHFFALMDEYTYRYEKKHKCSEGDLAYMLQSPPHNLREYTMTVMPSAMAPEFVVSYNPVENYRNYYKNGKKHLFAWKKRTPPNWIN